MTEEEYFRKHYPDSCYGERPLSPYWDFFQDGVEFGERQSEKKIEDFEKENAKLKARLNAINLLTPELEKSSKLKKQQLAKARYTLNKIIETVCNDRIDEYGARLVLINDFAYKCLQEIKENE